MKKNILTLILTIINGLVCLGQHVTPTSQSNPSLDFTTFLSGVKYAEILTSPEVEQFMITNPSSAEVFLGASNYFEAMGFEAVGFSAKFRDFTSASICDVVKIKIDYNVSYIYIKDFTLVFYSCNGDSWTFKRDNAIIMNGYGTVTDKTYKACKKLYGYKKPNYDESNKLKLKSETTNWSEIKLKSHFLANGADPLEGIYENTENSNKIAKYKVGIIKNSDGYDIIYLSGANNYNDWQEGELKAKLTTTATPTMFKAEWYMSDKSKNNDFYINFETGIMNVFASDKSKQLYIKLFPSASDNVTSTINNPASGTGFAISPNGLIVTNHHVTNGATKIMVRGINGDFNKRYNAKIVIDDKNNDISIIEIDDPSFTNIATIPYVINSRTSDVGTSIFVLGYPLRATMGDEIKLTNGIISSKSGFQGDITTYQLTAPVQPGNSGGPLFDEKGNLIGIINAKHSGAENVTYAIKSSYLLNLIELMTTIPTLTTVSTVTAKTLSDQVKILKKFTYIIEIN